jgi:hypothetical protein
MKTEHKYAQVLRWIADGDEVQIRQLVGSTYTSASADRVLVEVIDRQLTPECFRLKPRTITVNGREIVAGETVEPSFGTKYYAADPYSTVFFSDDKWSGWPEHHEWLRRGLVHLTKENAIAHAKAMLGID